MIDITKEVTEALLDHGDEWTGCDQSEELEALTKLLRGGEMEAVRYSAEMIIAPHLFGDDGYGPHAQAESALLAFALRRVDWLRVRKSLEANCGQF